MPLLKDKTSTRVLYKSISFPASDVVRIGSIIIFHVSKLWKANFSILCYVILLVRLQGKFDIDHSRE